MRYANLVSDRGSAVLLTGKMRLLRFQIALGKTDGSAALTLTNGEKVCRKFPMEICAKPAAFPAACLLLV